MTPFQDEIVTEDLQSGLPPRGHVRRGNGDILAVGDMGVHHLKKTHAKLLREEPYRIQEIEDCAAEIAKRDAEYASTQAEGQEQ